MRSEDAMNIDFPFQFDARGRTAACDDAAHVRDMLEQLLFTNAGERVNRPEFGSGLLHLVFAANSPELAAALQFTTRAAIQQWLGDVLDLQLLEVTSDNATLSIEIRYATRRTGEVRDVTFVRSTQ
jgi:phage baseplate assembly protein W